MNAARQKLTLKEHFKIIGGDAVNYAVAQIAVDLARCLDAIQKPDWCRGGLDRALQRGSLYFKWRRMSSLRTG